MRFVRLLSIALISVFVSINLSAIEVEQPPFDVPEPGNNENFRIVYYAVRDLQKLISDNPIGIGSVVFVGTDGKLTGDTTNFYWDDTNNRLGIGTSSPDSLLHIFSPIDFQVKLMDKSVNLGVGSLLDISARDTGQTYPWFVIQSSHSNNNRSNEFLRVHTAETGSSSILIRLTQGGSTDSPTNTRFIVESAGNVGIGTSSPDSRLEIEASGTGTNTGLSIGRSDGGQKFHITDVSSNLRIGSDDNGDGTVDVDIMTIEFGGDIGIGTTNPAAGLHVVDGEVRLQTDGAFYSLVNTAGTRRGLLQAAEALSAGVTLQSDQDGAVMRFITIGTSSYTWTSDGIERMRINAAGEVTIPGNVGIGTATPTALLHVAEDGSGTGPLVYIRNEGSGDPTLAFVPDSTLAGYMLGIDSSNLDNFKLSNSTSDLATNTLLQIAANGFMNILPIGAADVELEVSDGTTVGAGTIHRAASAAHSSRNIKSDIRQLSIIEKQLAYDDVKFLKPVEFRYKVCFANDSVTGDCLYRRDPKQKLRRGYLFEDAPQSIREERGKAIVIDDRLMNTELAMQIIIEKVEILEASARGSSIGQRVIPTPTLSSTVNDLMTENKRQQMEIENLKTKTITLENRIQRLELRPR